MSSAQRPVNTVLLFADEDEAWCVVLSLVREFIPLPFGGHLLLTTRTQTTGQLAHRIEVETMPQETGALFLLRRAKRIAPDAQLVDALVSDQDLARTICDELGELPLALDQAGAYIEKS